jgi:DNA-binding MarR family transcriptional regulator
VKPWTADGGRLPVISEAQGRVLLALADGGGLPVTDRELAKAQGTAHTGVAQTRQRLRARGLIAWEPKRSRTVHLTELGADFVAGLRSLEGHRER